MDDEFDADSYLNVLYCYACRGYFRIQTRRGTWLLPCLIHHHHFQIGFGRLFVVVAAVVVVAGGGLEETD
eukprot:Awhi_evm1s15570